MWRGLLLWWRRRNGLRVWGTCSAASPLSLLLLLIILIVLVLILTAMHAVLWEGTRYSDLLQLLYYWAHIGGFG